MSLIAMAVEYDKNINRIVLLFYDTDRRNIIRYVDQSGFLPYCLTSVPLERFYEFCRFRVPYLNQNKKYRQNMRQKQTKQKNKNEEEETEEEEEESEEEIVDIDNSEDEEEISDIEEDLEQAVKNALNETVEIDKEPDIVLAKKMIKKVVFSSLPVELCMKFNPLTHKLEPFTKIYGQNPYDIENIYNNTGIDIVNFLDFKLEEEHVNYAFENDLSYKASFICDNQIVFGMPYQIEKKQIMVTQPKVCPICQYTESNFYYYIKRGESNPTKTNSELAKIICTKCNHNIFLNDIIVSSNEYYCYMMVTRMNDIEHVSKVRYIPVQIEQQIDPKIIEHIRVLFSSTPPEEQELAKLYMPYFFTEIPTKLYRAAMDIEVCTNNPDQFPTPEQCLYPVSDVTFTDTDGQIHVFLLKIWKEEGNPFKEFPHDKAIISEFEKKHEKEMLSQVFQFMIQYPMLVTFNGNNFDFPYLFFRAKKLKIPDTDIPFKVRHKPGGRSGTYQCDFTWGCMHFDLYPFFSCRALKIYAFKGKYTDDRLGSISKALLGKTKVSDEIHTADGKKKSIMEYNRHELLYYCYTDTILTLELTTYGNYIVLVLCFLFMRLSKTGFDEFHTHEISNWIRNMLNYAHRQKNWLIQQKHNIMNISSIQTNSDTGKSFQGAYVQDTIPGIHFNITVMDFASLYPTIIKMQNISYETVDCCDHPECKQNIVPETTHYICTKERGIVSVQIATIRDWRVLYFKEEEALNEKKIKQLKLDKKETEAIALKEYNGLINIIQSCLKVFINGSYGVISSEIFLYASMGAGECVTAYGRNKNKRVEAKAKEMGIMVVLGDTDSSYMKNLSKEQEEFFISWSEKELLVPLDVDARYKFIAISNRKKNYVAFYKQIPGITPESPLWKKPSMKGVAGKKSNAPPYFKEKFAEIVNKLEVMIDSDADIPKATEFMKEFLHKLIDEILKGTILLEKLIVAQKLTKDLWNYGNADARNTNRRYMSQLKSDLKDINSDAEKTTLQINCYKKFNTAGFPQVPKCALLAVQYGQLAERGDYIRIIKTKKPNAIPYIMMHELQQKAIAQKQTKEKYNIDLPEIDTLKYFEILETIFSQLYDCFGLSAELLIKNRRLRHGNTSIDQFLKK